MVFTFLVVIPSSEGYDFLGEPNHKNQTTKGSLKDVQEEVAEDIPVQEENLNYAEIEYSVLQSGNIWEKLPASDSGNYVIVYRSQNCPYCDKLIAELKGNIGDYTLVVVKCSGTVRDVFYRRWIYQYPAFLVIKGKNVRYYGYGYRSLEEFKRFL